ncbi:MAG TPA: hypothetical protein VHC22_32735 [Pirellulales bacterium]|nr:hypothetical protein [Pirellulales bacterium]
MFTDVPEELLQIVEDIGARGSAELTRLTVLKKWFKRSERLVPFAVWVAARATSRKGKTTGEAAQLFGEARALLKGLNQIRPEFDQAAARGLYDRLREFHKENERLRRGPLHIVRNRNLLVIEKALTIMLDHAPKPNDGYRLAADYCRHDDPHYAERLSGPSETKILEIVRFMFTREALEDWPTTSTRPASQAVGRTKRRGKAERER